MSENKTLQSLAQVKTWMIYGLIFLFPVAGVSVRHWFSAIFSVLMLVSLWDLIRYLGKRETLFKEEKIWLWLCALFFLTFVISSVINGWGHVQNRALGVDIRYLAVVPMYLMLRQYPESFKFLLTGLLFAAPLLAMQAYYDTEVLGLARAQGEYSPNLLGPVAALVAVWLICSWYQWNSKLQWVLPLLILAALWAVAMSGSRGAFLGLMAMLLVWCGFCIKGWWRAPALLIILTIPLTTYHVIPSVKHRVDAAVTQIEEYFQDVDEEKKAEKVKLLEIAELKSKEANKKLNRIKKAFNLTKQKVNQLSLQAEQAGQSESDLRELKEARREHKQLKREYGLAQKEVKIARRELKRARQESVVYGTAIRFEMWRAGWMVFKEAPLLGVGPSNYTKAVKQFVGVDGLPEAVAHHGQAHNAYVDILMSRGVIGFVVFLGMLFYPLYCFIKTRSISPSTAIFGMTQVVGYAVFAMTDASPFDKGNFASVYLVCMTIFFSRHMAKVNQRRC